MNYIRVFAAMFPSANAAFADSTLLSPAMNDVSFTQAYCMVCVII